MFSNRKYSQFAITTTHWIKMWKSKLFGVVERCLCSLLLVLPACAGCCGFPLCNEFFHLCCSETKKKKKKPNDLYFFSLVSSLPMRMAHTHKRTKLQLVVGQPTALQLCASSVWSLESASSSSSVAVAVFFLFFGAFLFSIPPAKLTC